MDHGLEFQAARTPRTLWIELTSKCPFDCIFCSRKTRRGAGQHLPFPVYQGIVQDLMDARKFVLNYSGESTVYPDLIPAIQLARSAGAFVELVSALATVPESMLQPLSESGLNRLTVSVHATDPEKYAEIYRYSSFATLRVRLERFVELCRRVDRAPVVDLAFVAMDTNLPQLPSVVSLAGLLGLRDIFIFPVMVRDEIPVQFPGELTAAGTHRPQFGERLRSMVSRTAASHPEIRLTICNESFTEAGSVLGEVPRPYPGPLPPGAHIHSCEQNPWETTHVLSNGDVVACEVLDKVPLGNLCEQSMAEIWHGHPYQNFRERYRRGEVAECRSCPWKRAYLPKPATGEIVASRGLSAQLLYGWHDSGGASHIWSSQQAFAVLSPRAGSRTLHVSGMLPPGPEGDPNTLAIRLNETEIGRVENPGGEVLSFGVDLQVGDGQPGPWRIEFRTKHVYRPIECGTGSDQRDLGFALLFAVSKELEDTQGIQRRDRALQPLGRSVEAIDRWGGRLKHRFQRSRAAGSDDPLGPGVSILIPERDNLEELTECLGCAHQAAAEWTEPIETIVVVNGSREELYEPLRRTYPDIRWSFCARALGFGEAVCAGIRKARYDWVYLLNNDVALDRGALRAIAPYRDARTFAVASQIMLKDLTRFREETNWSSLLVESGVATIHDWIPRSDMPAETFYAGGGSSLFQTRLLRRFLDASAYAPFYWEDVEWGWRARKLGYRSVFCAHSIAHHRQRATIGKHYTAAEVERIIQRNRFLFQLRNFTTAGSLSQVLEAIARSPQEITDYFLDRRTLWKIACGRIWNHLAPIEDEEVFATWKRSVSTC